MVLKQKRCLSSPPPQSAATYATGLITLVGTYRMHAPLFRHFDGSDSPTTTSAANEHASSSSMSTKSSSKNGTGGGVGGGNNSAMKKATGVVESRQQRLPPSPPKSQIVTQGYVPPKNIGELFKRGGGATLARMGALSVAFLAAGALQTYAAFTVRNSKS